MLIFHTWVLCLVSVTVVIGDESLESTIFLTTTEAYLETMGFEDFTQETTTFAKFNDDPDSNTVESNTETTFIPSSTFSFPMPIPTKFPINPVVNVQEGALKGVYKKGFYHFMGIKYGQAPIEERR